MSLSKFPWIRTISALAIAGWIYQVVTKEPIVYEPMSVTQAYAGRDTLEDHHLRIEGIPSKANYFFDNEAPFSDKDGISFVLTGEEDSHIICYSTQGNRDESGYSRFKAFIDYHTSAGNRLVIDGEMKDNYFEFTTPQNLEELLADKLK